MSCCFARQLWFSWEGFPGESNCSGYRRHEASPLRTRSACRAALFWRRAAWSNYQASRASFQFLPMIFNQGQPIRGHEPQTWLSQYPGGTSGLPLGRWRFLVSKGWGPTTLTGRASGEFPLCVLAWLWRKRCPLALRALLGHRLSLLLVQKYWKLEVMGCGDVPPEAEVP